MSLADYCTASNGQPEAIVEWYAERAALMSEGQPTIGIGIAQEAWQRTVQHFGLSADAPRPVLSAVFRGRA